MIILIHPTNFSIGFLDARQRSLFIEDNPRYWKIRVDVDSWTFLKKE